jgi:hypothetical protein
MAWIRKHPGLEFVELPNFQVGQVSHYSDVANDFSAFSQQRMNQHSALAVQCCLLAVVVRSIKELPSRWIHRWQQRKPLLNRLPFGQRVDANAVACQTRDIKLFAVLLVDQTPE